jgi:hypothetical protein
MVCFILILIEILEFHQLKFFTNKKLKGLLIKAISYSVTKNDRIRIQILLIKISEQRVI